MAYLEISVGSFTQQITANNVNAQRVIQGVLTQYGYDPASMTGDEQLQTALAIIKQFMLEAAHGYEVNTAVEAARQAAIADPPVFT